MNKLALSLIVAGGTLALGACATHPTQPKTSQQVAKGKSHMVCISGTPVGSHIPQTICMAADQYKAYKKALKQQHNSMEQTMQANRPTPALR